MNWRLTKVSSGWVIEYRAGSFSGWKVVNQSRHYPWEPYQPAVFSSKHEASVEMARLIEEYC